MTDHELRLAGEDILEQYRAGVLDYDDARFEFEQLGYSFDDAIGMLDWA